MTPKLLALTGAALLALSAVATATVPSTTSLGIACPANTQGNELFPFCSSMRIDSAWDCAGSGCTLEVVLTIYNPGGHCTQAALQAYRYIQWCSSPGDNYVIHTSFVGDEADVISIPAVLCIDGNGGHEGEWDTECAHWTHVTPGDSNPGDDEADELLAVRDAHLMWQNEGTSRCTDDVGTCPVYTVGVGAGTSPVFP